MKDEFRTLSQKEVQEMLSSRSKKEKYKMKGHSFTPLKGFGKQVCKTCGLMALRNRATDWCINKGCNYADHPSYEQAMKSRTKSLTPA